MYAMKKIFPTTILLALIAGTTFANSIVSQFRGTDGQGHEKATDLPTRWSETENLAWKTTLPGRGHSTPVSDGKNLWITTAYETKASAENAEKRLKKNTGRMPLLLLSNLKLNALCVDATTGEILKNIPLLELTDPQWVHEMNSYASPTPILDDHGHLFCHFGSYGNVCLDTKSGKVLWSNQELEVMHENGPGGSPVLWQDRLVMNYDGSDKQFVAALDTKTGKLAWKTTRSGEMNENPQLQKAYATPLIVKINGKDVVVSPGANWLYGYDPKDGTELWKVSYNTLGFSNVSRPVTGHGHIYFATCFMKSEMLAVGFENKKTPDVSWRWKKGVPSMGSPLLIETELYFIDDKTGIMTCLDAITGDEIWRERLGGSFSASPMYADGKIYVGNRDGEVSVLQPGRSFKLLSKNTLDGRFYASPIVVDNALILRTDKALYRIK